MLFLEIWNNFILGLAVTISCIHFIILNLFYFKVETSLKIKSKYFYEIFSSLLTILGLFLICFAVIDRFIVEILLLVTIFNIMLTFLDQEPIKLFINYVLQVIPHIKENFMTLFSLYLLFACIGIHIFGGKLTNETVLEYNGNKYSEFYKYSTYTFFLDDH